MSSRLNLLVYLNCTSDSSCLSSNAPNLENFRWSRALNGIQVNDPISANLTLAPGETRPIFSGTRTLTQDGTTQYSLSQILTPSGSVYQLTWTGGTAPTFRTARSIGGDSTTAISTTINGPLITFTSIAGTPLDLSGVVVGDYVTLGSPFNILNQGTFQVLAFTATSFTVENLIAVVETGTIPGASLGTAIQIYSAAGVQINDTLSIYSGFSPVSWGSYKISAVTSGYVQFSSVNALPQESNIMTEIIIYSNAKQFVYLESDNSIHMIYNGSTNVDVDPFVIGECTKPGLFMLKSVMYSLSLTNNGLVPANVFLVTVE